MAIQFSQAIEQGSLQAVDVRLIAQNKGSQWDLNDVNTQLQWLTPMSLSIQISRFDPQIESVDIRFNQNPLSSVTSTSGNWLDGDKDGIPGGEVHYEYAF